MPSLLSVCWLAVGALVVAFAALDVGLGAQAYLGLGALASMVVLYVLRPGGWLRLAIVLFALFVSLRYLIWRYTETLPPLDTIGFVVGLVLVLAETHGFVMHALGMFTNANPRDRKPAPLPARSEALPSVDVFIPTYDEPASLVRQTVLAATQLRYPKHKLKVHLLDDGGTDAKVWADPENAARARELQELCAATGATYRTRPDNAGAKAGNVNTALADTAGDLVLILDSDHIPTVDFLERTVGYFLDRPNLAFVQTPHFFRNPDPIERNLDTFAWMPSEGEMFYGHTLKGMDHWNGAFFCGSAAVIARPALEAVGGISTTSITEDADTALNMHAEGFESLYLDRPMVAGVAPDTFAAFVQQRTRWCQGMLQILTLNNPLAKPGLRLPQRLSYLNSVIFWFFSLTRLTFLLVPLAFIFFNLQIIDATFPEFVAFIAPHIFVALTLNNFLYGKLRLPFVSDVYETAQSLFMAPAVMAVLRNPRKPSWRVTPKNEVLTTDLMSQLAAPVALLFAAIVAAEAAAVWRLVHEPFNVTHLAIVLTWNTLNLVVVTAAFGATLERGSAMQRLWMPVGTRAFARRGDATIASLIERSNGEHADVLVKPGATDRFVRGERLRLSVEHGLDGIGRDLEGTVLDARREADGSSRYRVAFAPATIEDERTQIATLYGSSERWVAFQAGRRHRRSLLTGLVILAVIGLRQLRDIAGVLVRAPGRRATRRPAPATAPAGAGGLAAAAVVLALLGVLLFGRAAAAQEDTAAAAATTPTTTAEAAPTVSPGASEARVVTLRSLTRDGDLPTLDVDRPRAAFDFVVTPNTDVEALELQLGWVSSPELDADPRGLELRLNGELVDRLPVVPTGRQQDARIALPTDDVRAGRNTLELVGRYTRGMRCERPDVESWTGFSAGQSFLELATTAPGDAATLADLDRASWRWGIADRGVTLLTTRTPDDALLTTGANLAGALSLRREQPGLRVRHRVVRPLPATEGAGPRLRLRPEALAAGVNVLFGTADELAEVLPAGLVERIDRPVVGLQRLAAAPESVVVVLSGRTQAEVHMAAATLANRDLVLPDAAWAELPQTLAPNTTPRRTLRSDTRYRFDNRGVLRFDAAAQRLGVMMPAGLMALDNRKLTLRLDYAHAPGLPAGAVLEVLVNGRVVRQLKLDDPDGAMVRDRRVRLELAGFRPGANEIAFRAGLVGRDADACATTPDAWVEVFAESELEVPPLVDVNRYPDLALLTGDGPLGRGGGRALGFTVAAPDPGVIAAAWTLAGRVAASHEQALPQLEMRLADPAERPHGVWIGTADLLDPRVATASGLADVVLGGDDATRIAQSSPATTPARRSAWLDELDQVERTGIVRSLAESALAASGLDTALRAFEPVQLAPERFAEWRSRATAFFRLDQVAEVTRLPRDRSFDAALAGLPRHGANGELGAELFVVAVDPEVLERAVADLVRPDRWAQLEGTAAAWRLDAEPMATATPVLPVAVPTDVSLSSVSLWYANWFAANPARWFLVVVAGAIGLGVAISSALGRGDAR
ncbi:MAG: UDP-forming cellulose synthase catalytic subunit [Alphaproteobacteria bacterium]|jgi:cellulose synthase (UDP-forming)|nr:UDP-forming cellulose synthase catalytic subunit [Alphaproteobacteria bacterium]